MYPSSGRPTGYENFGTYSIWGLETTATYTPIKNLSLFAGLNAMSSTVWNACATKCCAWRRAGRSGAARPPRPWTARGSVLFTMQQIRINTICTLSIAVSLFLVIAVLIAYVSTSSYRMVAGVQVDNLDQTARLVAQSAQNSIQDAAAVANALAGQTAILEAFTGSPRRAQERFQTYVAAFPAYWSFFLFDTNGRVLAGLNAEHKDLTGGDRLHRDYSQAIFGGKDLAFSQGIMNREAVERYATPAGRGRKDRSA